jgi:hypothetical protein
MNRTMLSTQSKTLQKFTLLARSVVCTNVSHHSLSVVFIFTFIFMKLFEYKIKVLFLTIYIPDVALFY